MGSAHTFLHEQRRRARDDVPALVAEVERLRVCAEWARWHIDEEWPNGPIRTARYVLQSGYARTQVAAEYGPRGVTPDADFLINVLYLRYRRRA